MISEIKDSVKLVLLSFLIVSVPNCLVGVLSTAISLINRILYSESLSCEIQNGTNYHQTKMLVLMSLKVTSTRFIIRRGGPGAEQSYWEALRG